MALTEVTFRELDRTTLETYLASGEWRDRAGAYAIQGLGSILVERVEGDFSNVVGLPVRLLLDLAPELLAPPDRLATLTLRSILSFDLGPHPAIEAARGFATLRARRGPTTAGSWQPGRTIRRPAAARGRRCRGLFRIRPAYEFPLAPTTSSTIPD